MRKISLMSSMMLVILLSINADVRRINSLDVNDTTILKEKLLINYKSFTHGNESLGYVFCSLDLQDRDTDPNSVGFFDQYRREYRGDPNRIKAKKAKVQTEKIEETLEQKRQRLLRELDNIEAENKNDVKNYERLQEKKEEVRSKIDEAELLNKRKRRRQIDGSVDNYSSIRSSESRVRRRLNDGDDAKVRRRASVDSFYDDSYDYRY